MKTETRIRQVEHSVYITTDGREFVDKDKAEHHEKILNGGRKNCQKCNGNGRINGRYETLTWNYGHTSSEVWKDDKCDICNGKGFLEQKWV